MSGSRIVKLRVSELNSDAGLSSGNVAEIMGSGLTAADFLDTWIRYGRLPVEVYNNAHPDSPSSSNGKAIDAISGSEWLAILHTLAVLFCVAGTVKQSYHAIKCNNERKVGQLLINALTPTEQQKDAVVQPDQESMQRELDAFNKILRARLANNKKLSDKYSSIKVMQEDGHGEVVIEMEKKEEPKVAWWDVTNDNWKAPWVVKKAVNTADATSDSLGFMSYAYWILFISAAIVTGVFGLAAGGIAGLPDLVGFGVPLAAGLGYGGYKAYNMYKNRNIPREEQADFKNLAKDALLAKEEEAETAKLKGAIVAKRKSSVFTPELAATVVVNAAAVAVVGTYVAWQYNLWYVTDILSKMFQVAVGVAAEAIGVGIFVTALVACARAAINAFQSYRAQEKPKAAREKELLELARTDPAKALAERAADKAKLDAHKTQQTFLLARRSIWDYFKFDSTIILQNQKKVMDELEKKLLLTEAECQRKGLSSGVKQHDALLDKMREVDAKAYTTTGKQELRNLAHVGNFAMTGIFVARTIIIPGTVSFLLPGLAVAVMLSNPITIGVLVGAGVLWGLYKYYNYRKEKNAQKLAETNARIELIEKKQYILDCRIAAEPQKVNGLEVANTVAVRNDSAVPSYTSTAAMAAQAPSLLSATSGVTAGDADTSPRGPVREGEGVAKFSGRGRLFSDASGVALPSLGSSRSLEGLSAAGAVDEKPSNPPAPPAISVSS